MDGGAEGLPPRDSAERESWSYAEISISTRAKWRYFKTVGAAALVRP